MALDNASIHHSDEIADLIEQAGAKIVHLPPHSPDLNPIQFVFGECKKGLKRHCFEPNWCTAHIASLSAVTPNHARNFFHHCGIPGTDDIHAQEENSGRVRLAAAAVAAQAAAWFFTNALNN